MSFVYYKIENIYYNNYNLYFKKPIVESLTLAAEFNDKYTYFFKCPITDKLFPLGKFKSIRKGYEFTKGFATLSETDNIYCKGIPESGENMILLEGMFNMEFPIYYHKVSWNKFKSDVLSKSDVL